MDFTWIKQLPLLLTAHLASITTVLLLTGTIGIVNNGNILTDGRNERKYLRRNTMNFNNNDMFI